MKIDRRSFIAGVGGTAGAITALRGSSCIETDPESASVANASGIDELEPQRLRDRLNNDGEFRVRARYWDATVRLDVGVSSYDVRVENGRIASLAVVAGPATADVTISGASQAWAQGFAARGLAVTGDQVAHTAPYRGAILRIIALVREMRGQSQPLLSTEEVDREFDAAVGRYVYVRIAGVQYRVYYEETGRGIPLMVQHLAGSDGRVWRHLLEDTDVQQNFRIIVYDLPYHGRSLPPPTVPWWTQEYRLTERFFMDAVLAISAALRLERPVFLGNGIGGSLAPALALHHPDAFRAVIAMNSMVASAVPFARSIGRPPRVSEGPNPAFHPRVGNERHGTTVYELTSQNAPESGRRELEWIFRQGAPGVFAGDLQYFSNDHDLTGGKAAQIDTSKIEVHFVSGEYQAADNVGPNSAESLAAQIPGSTYAVSRAGSHPMLEDYPRFRQTLIPILSGIDARHARRA